MILSILMPVFNERATITTIIQRVMAVDAGCEKELVIVDDFSTDGTREFLKNLSVERRPGIKIVLHEHNQGKGAAIRTGLQHTTGEVVLIQDADLEYDPSDYPKLLDPFIKGQADVVYGNRFHGGVHRVLYFWHSLGNQVLTFLSNLLTNLNLSDMEVGYKVFRADVLKRITLKSNRFGFEPEVTEKVAKLGCRIYEVPIAYHGRTYAEGKKITWKDGISALWCLVRFRYFD